MRVCVLCASLWSQSSHTSAHGSRLRYTSTQHWIYMHTHTHTYRRTRYTSTRDEIAKALLRKHFDFRMKNGAHRRIVNVREGKSEALMRYATMPNINKTRFLHILWWFIAERKVCMYVYIFFFFCSIARHFIHDLLDRMAGHEFISFDLHIK